MGVGLHPCSGVGGGKCWRGLVVGRGNWGGRYCVNGHCKGDIGVEVQ